MTRVAVVGLGLMGASFAMALRRAQPELTVLGVDRDQAAVSKAVQREIVTAATTDLEAIAGASPIILAVPISALAALLPRVGALARGSLVTDMASTKTNVMSWARAAGVDLVGGHPMCGREMSGTDAADPEIFRNAPWALTRHEAGLEQLIRAVGARPLVIAAERHDELVAAVSHAAFLISIAYVLGLAASAEWPEMAALAGSGFRDMSRLAAGDPGMYAEIAAANRDNIERALDEFGRTLDRLRRHVSAGDSRMVELFEEARAARRRWEAQRMDMPSSEDHRGEAAGGR
jgi:prephenate dehydrogenase